MPVCVLQASNILRRLETLNHQLSSKFSMR